MAPYCGSCSSVTTCCDCIRLTYLIRRCVLLSRVSSSYTMLRSVCRFLARARIRDGANCCQSCLKSGWAELDLAGGLECISGNNSLSCNHSPSAAPPLPKFVCLYRLRLTNGKNVDCVVCCVCMRDAGVECKFCEGVRVEVIKDARRTGKQGKVKNSKYDWTEARTECTYAQIVWVRSSYALLC
jgi:hypothetical protein